MSAEVIEHDPSSWCAACWAGSSKSIRVISPVVRDARQSDPVDVRADLNAQDDDANGWSLIGDACDAARIVPGAMVLAGSQVSERSRTRVR